MKVRLAALSLSCATVWMALPVHAERVSDVRATKHNFSATAVGRTTGTQPTRNVRATSETEVCVFCHTPHAANTSAPAPLWNRQLSSQTYTPYSSSTLDAEIIRGQALEQPGGSSKLCLSCHDGTLAIGNVNVLGGDKTVSIGMTGTGTGGVMPDGSSGKTTGYTRNLGIDLSNDHPISVTFNSTLATRDGELRAVDAQQRWPAGTGTVVGVRSSGFKPATPLEPTGSGGEGQIQCASCHDPHMYDTAEATKGPQKFLRLNRFQEVQPTASFSEANDIVCLACHDKNGNAGSWAYSAHANSNVADETYKTTAASQRDFPNALPVWKAACLNCHDTHTVQGARRLLREGTDSALTPKAGGNPALEETCYQCHTTTAASILNTATGSVPDIKSDFNLARHMPIKSTDQAAGQENHQISSSFSDGIVDCTGLATAKCGADFLEDRSKLGVGNLTNRHAECTDCHNPHRVVRFMDFRGASGSGSLSGTPDATGTHRHTNTTGYTHSNIISGVLRGAWGVEPTYSSASFADLPSGYDVKRGDPGASVDTSATATHVTREYQICLKCHSDYGYSDNNVYPNGNRPSLGGTGLTAANANGHSNFTTYTNQAKEFQAPSAHAVDPGSVSLGTAAGAELNANNHRAWHPVMRPTGRTGRASGGFLSPWNNALGTQTMYCSDCHGTATDQGTAIPTGGDNGNPWGPHGSTNNFLLKGDYSTSTGSGQESTGLCFKCHNASRYAGTSGGTGFQTTDKGDGHAYHRNRIGSMRCNWCHIAVPHGWKNRNLLVNLNDVGPEAGLAQGTNVSYTNNVGYTNGPYYRKAFLKISSFPSGSWSDSNCNGGRSGMRSNCDSPN